MENIRLLCLPLEQFQDPLFYPHLFQHSNWPLTLMKLLSTKAPSLPCFSLQGIPPLPPLFYLLLQLSWLFPKYLLSFPSHNSLLPFYSQIWGLFFPGFLFLATKSSLRVGSTTKQGDAQLLGTRLLNSGQDSSFLSSNCHNHWNSLQNDHFPEIRRCLKSIQCLKCKAPQMPAHRWELQALTAPGCQHKRRLSWKPGSKTLGSPVKVLVSPGCYPVLDKNDIFMSSGGCVLKASPLQR